jgi:hypothetical protein
LTRLADTKATAILAVDGIMSGFYFSNATTLRNLLAGKPIEYIPLALSVFFIISSASFSARCLLPRVVQISGSDVVSFTEIAKKRDANAYLICVKETMKNNDGFSAQLCQLIWSISKVAQKKLEIVGWAVTFFVLALLATIALVITIIL